MHTHENKVCAEQTRQMADSRFALISTVYVHVHVYCASSLHCYNRQ